MGRNTTLTSPDHMWELYTQYKNWCKENPRIENIVNNKTGEIIPVPRERPLNWSRFNTWAYENEIINDFEDYKYGKVPPYDAYNGVVSRIDKDMYSDKIEGASVGIYNASIVARELSLVEKQELSVQEEPPLFPDVT
jgi:hypothetical protein